MNDEIGVDMLNLFSKVSNHVWVYGYNRRICVLQKEVAQWTQACKHRSPGVPDEGRCAPHDINRDDEVPCPGIERRSMLADTRK